MQNFTHKSVLLEESIKLLDIDPQGIYLDLTFGRGGHSKEILQKLTTGKLIAFDKDIEAVEYGKKNIKEDNFEIIYADFSNCYEIIKAKGLLGKINGILLDLGVSSPQLDNKARGFSFNSDSYLDMRMDTNSKLDAKTFLEQNDEKTIADVIYKYGEEKKSRQIARKIKEFQKLKELSTTKELSNIVSSVVWSKNKHPATRTFQAIRIFINNELEALESILNNSHEILKPGGVLAIISFHSLEDRIVKQFIERNSTAPNLPKNLPITSKFEPKFQKIKKIKASAAENLANKRARSAILRGAIKC